jgi:hypothetical protein
VRDCSVWTLREETSVGVKYLREIVNRDKGLIDELPELLS